MCTGFLGCGEWGPLSACNAWASHWGGFSCCETWALGHKGFSSCGAWALENRFKWLWHMGLVALKHVGSAQIRDWTHVSCTGRQFFTIEPRRKPRNDFISKGYILRYWVLELHIFWGDTSEPTAITKFSFFKVLWVKDVYSLWQDASCPPTIVLRFHHEGWSLQSSHPIWHCFGRSPCFLCDYAMSSHQWYVDWNKFVSSK